MGTVTKIRDEERNSWEWALRRYELHRRRDRLSISHLESHVKYHLAGLARSMTQSGITDVSDVTLDALDEYFAELSEAPSDRTGKPLSTQTQYSRFQAARSFFTCMVEVGVLDTNPMKDLKPPKVRTGPVTVVRAGEVRAILETCKRKKGHHGTRGAYQNTRDRAVILMLYGTGCRLGGLTGLDLDDVDLKEQRATVTEKGGQTRMVVFGVPAAEALDDWLRIRRGRPRVQSLFTSNNGKPLTTDVAGKMLRRRFAEAGLPRHSAHSFRRGWATNMARELSTKTNDGGRLAFKDLGGWKSWSMVERYVHMSEEDLLPMRDLAPDNSL